MTEGEITELAGLSKIPILNLTIEQRTRLNQLEKIQNEEQKKIFQAAIKGAQNQLNFSKAESSSELVLMLTSAERTKANAILEKIFETTDKASFRIKYKELEDLWLGKKEYLSLLDVLYLERKKSRHPERARFNPLVVDSRKFTEFIADLMNRHKEDPTLNYTCQCMVNGGHATMFELRIIDGKKTAIMLDAAMAFYNAMDNYIPTLVANGFDVKVFASDYLVETSSGNKPFGLQTDTASCKLFALSYVVQALRDPHEFHPIILV